MSVESGVGASPGRRSEADDVAPRLAPQPPLITRARRRTKGNGRPVETIAEAVSLPTSTTRRGQPRRQGRRVRRVVRRVELWSVLKVSLVFNAIMLGIALISVALLWGLANTTGLIDDLEGFLQDAGFEDFRFEGDRLFRQVAFIGALGALALSVFTVLATALINLISELTGGIRVVMIEEIHEDPVPASSGPEPSVTPRSRPSPFPDVDPPGRRGGPVGPPSSPPPVRDPVAPGGVRPLGPRTSRPPG